MGSGMSDELNNLRRDLQRMLDATPRRDAIETMNQVFNWRQAHASASKAKHSHKPEVLRAAISALSGYYRARESAQ